MLMAAISARGAAKAVLIAKTCLLNGGDPSTAKTPSHDSARLWLLRLGYHKLTRPKTPASDWIWIIDHTVQTGAAKCLVIFGVRLSTLDGDLTLSHDHMEPILIAPMATSNAATVTQKLTEATACTGVPRAIIADGGSDLRSGIRAYTEVNPSTAMIYDIHHKTAVELKRILEQDEAWAAFTKAANQFKRIVQQTPLAPMAPPSQRSKARFMNIDILVRWVRTVLLPACNDPAKCAATLGASETLVREKLEWVAPYTAYFRRWDELSLKADLCTEFIRREGYHADAADTLTGLLLPTYDASVTTFVDRMRAFIRDESAKAQPGERLPGCSDVIESVFGSFKRLEGEAARGGFTLSVLAIAALVAKTTREVIRQALESHDVKCIKAWAAQYVGKTTHATRRALARMAMLQEGT